MTRAIMLLTAALLVASSPAPANDLGDRITARDGWTILTFPLRDDITIDQDCGDATARLALLVRDGAVRDIDLHSTCRRHEHDGRDLGPQPAPEVAAIWPQLLLLARDRGRDDELRETALFWLGQAAGNAVAPDLEDIIADDDEDSDLREHAVFVLDQALTGSDTLVPTLSRIARENPHPDVRRSAMFWLSQHDDPRVVEFFERILRAE